jgi:hypothetical protein
VRFSPPSPTPRSPRALTRRLHALAPRPPPRSFYCQLVARDSTAGAPSTLSIMETNSFKQLTHLQLTLRSATDAGVKSYLAALLALSREQCAALSATSAALRAECGEKEDAIQRLRAFPAPPPPPSPLTSCAAAARATHSPPAPLPIFSRRR